ncbi:alpha/beta hydrolase [Paenibacillus chungangensis]|uniref:Alpha/beta hydrolase n=1 Tax=Paenibacillus chungangensis TaxID=696535 RepID=A0ABW3HTP6_9BACL
MRKNSHKGLVPLLAGLSTQKDWARKRDAILQSWLELVGGLPERAPVHFEQLDSVREANHMRLHIQYDAAYGDKVTAYLLVPYTMSRANAVGKLPAIMALHPTANAGKDDIAVESGREGRRYALELVERGYIVLAPDTITAGERKDDGADYFHTALFDKQYPEWSAVGKMLSDHLHGLDLLCSLPEVDPERVGAIGHSLGGYNAYFLAGMDERVKAVAVSCGLSTFYGDADNNRWGRRDWFSHLPRVTELMRMGKIDFDFHEIAALAAPTPFFCWIAQQDQYMPHWKEISEAASELHLLYEHLNVGDRFQALIGTSRHDFPDSIRQLAYAFLDKWLLGEP